MPRTALAAVAAATLIVLLGFASVASADPGDIGVKGPTFKGYSGNSGIPPTVSKPESKLWFNDGLWWGVMFDTVSRTFHIFKLDVGTQTWTDTGTAVDGNGTIQDALWDGSKLYVASHLYFEDGSATGNPSRLYRYSYNAGSDTYTLDAGFPAQINNTSSETLVIDKDSTGQLWATWTEVIAGQQFVMVNATTGGDATWGTPFQLSTNPLDAAAPLDDISSVIAFAGKIGVMWSDQSDKTMYFAIHNDADPDTTWSAPEIALGGASCPVSGGACADDHINLKTDGSRVFAAVKTNLTGANVTNYLLVRTAAGSWVKHAYGTASESHTRAIVVLDTSNGLARMFSTVTESGGTIYEKTLPLSQADTDGANFPAGLGTARITDADQLKMNNSTSTKKSVSAATGLVVLATNKKTNVTPQIEDYWHHWDPLSGGDATPPVLQTAAINGSTVTLTYNETLDGTSVPATGSYAVTVGGVARAVSTVTVTGVRVVLRLPAPVITGDIVVLSYTVPGSGPVQDNAGNDAASLDSQAVTNNTSAVLTYDLVPTGDGTRSAITTNSGGTSNLFAAVDESIALTDNDVTYIHNNATASGGQAGSIFLQLTDTPSNFMAMTGATIDLRARTIARIDDNTTVFAQLFKADEVTPLSAEVQVALNPGPANWVTISNVAFTGVVAGTKVEWDGARVKLRWLPVTVGTPDNGNRVRVSTVELDATYSTTGGGQAPGFLRAFTTPAGAVPANILLTSAGGSTLLWRNQWATDWMKLDPGVYTIAATAVEGFAPPSPQQVTITSGNTTTVDLHFQTLGNLRVILNPAVAGTITIDGDRVNDGGFFGPYPSGSHQICFGAVAGYDPPACQTVNVAANRTLLTTVTGTYTVNPSAVGETGVGYLRVALQPAGQVPALIYIDGKQRNQWALDWLKLPPGNYTISYSDVEGFRAPAPQQVTITAGQVTTLTPQFETLGNLRVRTNPSVSGTITVDGVPINDTIVWTPFPSGQHQVCFGPVAGFVAPPCQTVNVAADRTKLTDITGVYVPS